MSPLNITQPLGIWSIMATIRWCPIFPKWDIYQPLINSIHSPWFSWFFTCYHTVTGAQLPSQSPRTQALRCGVARHRGSWANAPDTNASRFLSAKIIQKWGEIMRKPQECWKPKRMLVSEQRGEQQISTNWNLDLIDDHNFLEFRRCFSSKNSVWNPTTRGVSNNQTLGFEQ